MSTDVSVPHRSRKRRALRRLRDRWRTLTQEQATPTRLGVAVGVGVLIGCSPFYGFQMLLAIAVAYVFRLNRLALLLGSNINFPPLTPLIILAGVQTGALLLEGRLLPLTLQMIQQTPAKELARRFITDFLVGGLVVGGVLGTILGVLTARAVASQRAGKPQEPALPDDELDALADRLERVPRRYRGYATWKVRLDPVYPLVLEQLAGRKALVDLGAGMGILAALALGRERGLTVHAVEWDARKAAVGRTLLADEPRFRMEEGDARKVALGRPDALTLLDVLHYVEPAEQREWLARCADALTPGGVLIVRELDSGKKKGNLAEKIDALAVRWGWNKGALVKAWSISEMTALLEGKGFTVAVRPAGKGMFKANALVVARKPASA